ncbi:zinc finger and SCAN domain containing protein 4D isoform X2 [Harpegnathos saltator]|nr:zinc finger and SCAN domain containing protein 4D isoform X2 [Harpegnathos saltator]XP_011136121.1 zinc finger and SCAN domain containing protein 4D isoform X2 [Harpegnathos saltator]
MGKELRIIGEESMENGYVYVFPEVGASENGLPDDDANAQVAAQPTRNLPNILRSSNAKAYKNCKTLILNKNDISFISNTEDTNMSFDSNTTLSRADSDKNSKYNKVASPKSHHQRKQVHHPLDTRYDALNWNNKKKVKNALQTIGKLETLYASLGHKGDTSTKKINNKLSGKEEKCMFKKSRGAASRKSDNRKTAKLSGLDTGSTIVPGVVDATDQTAVQNVTNDKFFGDEVFTDIMDVETKLDDILYRDNNIYNPEKKRNTVCNSVISGKSTECNTMQQDAAFRKDLLSYEFSEDRDNLEDDSMSKNTRSNFLFASEVLCTCTCANCTSCDKDFILCEDSVPRDVNSNMETEFFTPCAYDLYTSDYYHIFADIDDFDKKIFRYEEAENTCVTKESACDCNNISSCDTTKLTENDASAPTPVKQSDLEIFYSETDTRLQENHVETHSAEPITHSDDESTGSTGHKKDLDKTEHFEKNIEGISLEICKASQDQITASTKAFVSKNRPHRSKKDLYVIQCTQCSRLFNENKFRKHFTHCSFDKEDFKCHICQKIYRYKSSLVHHLKTVHHLSHDVYGKYYICNKCSKLYVRFRAFQRHLLIHNDWEVHK